ncbi:uncharacterized protein Z518_11309 [Rhinocladiella mackenziei CBS 650.93]|uniref:Methyltransferase type 11 domain-containing protein n=1 Tax=Rhinocladiella mackenziei CBS 650.93 TaxID=1442369 RepID=A0A0D2I8N0_9EURO|nr:uncharacterized protein Z518_11309 [Rhinocladiella mackenziei CBS 650.93]KIW99570.1 hypothetical protein Z518_11309 [Rhinocladiella mackenziei CBS 650.93]
MDGLPKAYFLAEKITQKFGQHLLDQSGILATPESQSLCVLDNLCGIGIVSTSLRSALSPQTRDGLHLTCLDISGPSVKYVKQKGDKEGWKNLQVKVGDAQDTQLPSLEYHYVFANIGPTFVKDPAAMMRECYRMLRARGVVAVSVWKEAGWWEDMKEAMASLGDCAPPFPSQEQLVQVHTQDPGWKDPGTITQTLQGFGFSDVHVTEKAEQSVLQHVDEYMLMHGMVLGLIMRFWTESQRQELQERASAAIEKYMRQKYGAGPVTWTWVAFVATGKK